MRILRWSVALVGPLAVLAVLAVQAGAQARAPIVISDPTAKQYRAAVQQFAPLGVAGSEGLAAELRASIEASLIFSGMFTALPVAAFLEPLTSKALAEAEAVTCPNWSQIGTDALVQGELETRPEGLRIEFRVLDVSRGCRRLLRKRYRGARDELSRIGKAVGDDIVAAFTGSAGVADTEIAYVSNESGNKEVYVMDADGGNPRPATQHRSINSFPAWSPDGSSILYTSYIYRRRPHLFLLTRGRPSPGRILRELNASHPLYRGVFEPSGRRLALVMSPNGSSEIYSVERSGGNLRRLTNNRAIDVSPSWSPDGRQIAFVSDRTGAPHVYLMDSDGGNQRRLTFDGSYNTAPAWSPDGRWIAYETRVRSQFDIWLIDPQGQVNLPLVSHPRSDEHPTWSPDGRMLAFSSTRRGRADIYAVDLTGHNLRRLTQDGGDAVNPAWGPYRR